MHLALKAYQELMSCINAMDQSPDAAIRSSAKVIKSKEPLLCVANVDENFFLLKLYYCQLFFQTFTTWIRMQ